MALKSFSLIVLLMGLGLPQWAHAWEYPAPSGATAIPILVEEGAPPRNLEAARLLADSLEKVTGQAPEILTRLPDPLPKRAIWVGWREAARPAFPGLKPDWEHPEEILIAANEHHLLVAGRDRWDPRHTTAKGRLAMKTDLQQEYGTANAVFTFLQDYLGIRWLWPEEEEVPSTPLLKLEPFEKRYHPPIRARAGMFVKLSLGDNKEGPDELWARYQRVQLDSLELLGGHAFGHWWDKYHETHPEFFAQYPDGSRRPHPTPHNTKLCDSNPEVWAQWLVEVEEQLKEDPTRRVFNVSPNDGYNFGHCVCDRCRAWDRQGKDTFTWSYGKGVQFEGPALSDRQVTLANTLARMLKKRFPDQELFVQLHAYGYSRPAPVEAVPDDNVIISSVANFHMRSPEARVEPMQQHADWARVARHLMWRPNLGSQAGLSWGMPDVAMEQAGEDFRFIHQNHGIGLFFDLFWFHWATQGPHYYALAHLAWDPQTDVRALMADYYRAGWGPAAASVQAYWELMEKTRMEFVAEHPSRQRAFDLPDKYTSAVFQQAQDHLDTAARQLQGGEPRYLRRLHFIQCGLDYSRLLVDTRDAMRRYEQSGRKDAKARDQVLANWDRIDRMKEEFPPYAINWQAVFRRPEPGKDAKRVMGLHPDAPLEGRTLRELQAVGKE